MLLGEVVAPELAPLLLNLLAIVGFLIALGLAILVSQLVSILLALLDHTVGKVPGVGGIISGAANWLGSQITGTLSGVISGLDKGIGGYWYSLGQEVYWIVNEIKAGANLGRILAEVTVGTKTLHAVITGVAGVVKIVHTLEHEARAAFRRIRALESAVAHAETGLIGKAIHAIVQPVSDALHGLDTWVRPKVTGIENELGQVIEPDIAALKQRATALENEAIRVYQDAAGVWHAVNVDAIAAAMVLALPALGWQWLRCSSLGSVTGSRGCGLWSDLDGILGLLADTFLIANVCEILPVLETVVSDVAAPIVEGLTIVGAGLCSGGIGAPPALPVPKLYLPPNPGYTLSLA